MGADQISYIKPALREFFQATQHESDPRGELCLTLSVPSLEEAWLQLMTGVLNFGYPLAIDPVTFFDSIRLTWLPGLSVDAWEKGLYVTLSHETSDIELLASFIDQLISQLHSLNPVEYEIDTQFEYLASS